MPTIREHTVREKVEPESGSLAYGAEMVWYGFLTVFFSIVALGAVSAAVAVLPASCATCHGPQADALAQGPHAYVHCDDCHSSPGPFGLVDNRLRVAAMVPAQFVPGGELTSSVDNAACLTCHESMLEETVEVDGIRMNHRTPEDRGWLCTSCHSDFVHGTGSSRGVGGYTMDTCLECHVQHPENISGCATCHVEGRMERREEPTPWRIIHGGNWRNMHGMGNLETCGACHGSDYCAACHVIEMPHPSRFLSIHGETAVSSPEAAAACDDCHARAACDGCHGLEMPHPDAFLPLHSELVDAEGDEVCYRCHEQANCKACHNRHAHPGLQPDVVRQLSGRPVKVD